MHDEGRATGGGNLRDEVARELVGVVVVDAEPRLDGDGHGDSGAHGTDALRHARRLEHQRSAETAGLDAVARTADVEIDLVVAGRSAEFRRGCKLAGITAAELQRDGVLGRIEAQQPVGGAVQQSARRDHLGI